MKVVVAVTAGSGSGSNITSVELLTLADTGGRGGLIFNTCVVPLLTAAQIDYHAIHTERAGHAVDICSELAQNDMVLNGQKYDALVSVSGETPTLTHSLCMQFPLPVSIRLCLCLSDSTCLTLTVSL